jgi:DNA mismatch repair protein MutS2
MNIKNTLKFIDFESFYAEYKPLTPYGLINKGKYYVFDDSEMLQQQHNLIGLVMQFINHNSFNSDKIENRLKKIPLLNTLNKKTFHTTDIFLVKKLLLNYKHIVDLLNDELIQNIEISFLSNELLSYLSPDGENKETFHLSASYSKELSEIREKVSEKDKALSELKKIRLQEIYDSYDLDFRFRDFIIVKEEQANLLDNDLVYKEVYDQTSLVVKPVLPKEYFHIHLEKEDLLLAEQKSEQEVLETISKKIIAEKHRILSYLQKIESLDILFAKARLAIKYEMSKPSLDENANITILNARYLPLANKCTKLGTTYTPLTAEFDQHTIVVTGSNMGGKTMLLRTIGFMQVLTQMGFWVPADHYSTTIFENISYIGEDLSDKVEGLSSFGFEIHNISEALEEKNSNSLMLIDEFAKTTNSLEAKAIIAAMLKSFSLNKSITCFLSTHFMELPQFSEVSFYKMKGLDYKEYENYYTKEKQYSLSERIKIINSFMRYEVVKTDSKDKTYDAIKIADILGLDKGIIKYTKQFLDNTQ